MTKHEIAYEIARGLIETGVEGGYDAVSCSTTVAQWKDLYNLL